MAVSRHEEDMLSAGRSRRVRARVVWAVVKVYVLAAGLMAGSISVLFLYLFGTVIALVVMHDPVALPPSGDGAVRLEPGRYVVWHQRVGYVDGKFRGEPIDAKPGRRVTVDSVNGPDGSAVTVDAMPRGGLGLVIIERDMIGEFEATTGGEYRIETTTEDGKAAQVTVARESERDWAVMIGVSVVVMIVAVGLMIAGFVALVWAVVRSVRQIRRAAVSDGH